LEILKVLWEQGPSSVREVHRHLTRLEGDADLAYNTVQTLLRIMETKKKLVEHRVEKRKFVYIPRFSRDDVAARFVDHVFDGAAAQMVLSLLRSERIPPAELERMHAMIAEARRQRRPEGPNPEAP
jgi:predicted transcriptional regulator